MPTNNDKINTVGRVVSVQGPVVDVIFSRPEEVPNIFGVIKTYTVDNEEVVLEVAEHMPGNIARCIAINSTINIQRNSKAYVEGGSIEIKVGDELYGRIVNILGQPIDEKGPLLCKEVLPIRKREMGSKVRIEK